MPQGEPCQKAPDMRGMVCMKHEAENQGINKPPEKEPAFVGSSCAAEVGNTKPDQSKGKARGAACDNKGGIKNEMSNPGNELGCCDKNKRCPRTDFLFEMGKHMGNGNSIEQDMNDSDMNQRHGKYPEKIAVKEEFACKGAESNQGLIGGIHQTGKTKQRELKSIKYNNKE